MHTHDFCRQLLADSQRNEKTKTGVVNSREWGITECTSIGPNKYFFVESSHGNVVWDGRACCKYNARSKAIHNTYFKDRLIAGMWGPVEVTINQ